MAKRILTVALVLLLAGWSTAAVAKTKVVATLPVLSDLAKQIGGDRVEVDAIARGNQDPHYVEVLPSHMLKLKRADIFLMVGMDLELWAKPLIDGSRNKKLKTVDCSGFIVPLEVPKFKVDARYGDLHPQGNPHYWLNPNNIPAICSEIRDGLIAVDPEGTDTYNTNMDRYLATLDDWDKQWHQKCQKLTGLPVVVFHNSWPYLCDYCGFDVVGFVEDYPGVAPSPSHVSTLLEQIKTAEIPAIIVEPHHDRRIPDMLARKSGADVVVLPTDVGGVDGADSYIDMMETIFDRLSTVKDQTKSTP